MTGRRLSVSQTPGTGAVNVKVRSRRAATVDAAGDGVNQSQDGSPAAGGFTPARARAATAAVPTLPTTVEVPETSESAAPASPALLAVPTPRRRRPSVAQRMFEADGFAFRPSLGVPSSPVVGSPGSPTHVHFGEGVEAHALEPLPASALSPGSPVSASSRPTSIVSAEPVRVIEGRTDEQRARARSGSLMRRLRGASTATDLPDVEEHNEQEVDILQVLDPSVSTAAVLCNIQNSVFPNRFATVPVVELSRVPSRTDINSDLESADHGSTGITSEETLTDPLDVHLARLLRKQRRATRAVHARQVLQGIWAFMKTPMGVFFTIYGVLVVFWGAGLVLILIRAIPMNSYDRKLWVEIASQILTGLFCITSLFPLPWRAIDTWNVFMIWHYARETRRIREKRHMAPLRDANDLPDPKDAEYWVGEGGIKREDGKVLPTVQPKIEKKKKKDKKSEVLADGSSISLISTDAMNSTIKDNEAVPVQVSNDALSEEEVVLTDKQEERLRYHQLKFCKSQTYYRPHSTPTHHATPIVWALWIAILYVGNSIFQLLLCVVMWHYNRWNRPAWTTGCLIPCSFLCGIIAAVLIWQSSEKTKKKSEVTRRVWQMLKQDEEEIRIKTGVKPSIFAPPPPAPDSKGETAPAEEGSSTLTN